jgi:hypothetical protein
LSLHRFDDVFSNNSTSRYSDPWDSSGSFDTARSTSVHGPGSEPSTSSTFSTTGVGGAATTVVVETGAGAAATVTVSVSTACVRESVPHPASSTAAVTPTTVGSAFHMFMTIRRRHRIGYRSQESRSRTLAT